jgi:adenylate cyclase
VGDGSSVVSGRGTDHAAPIRLRRGASAAARVQVAPGRGAAHPLGATVRGIEIERKFLVAEPPSDLERWPSTAIEQGYLAVDEDGTEVRVRRRDGRSWLTVKSGAGRVRVEEEVEIEADRFERLWPLTEGRRIEKTRYEIPLDDGLVIELDVYTGGLDGLVTAEVEFGSEETAEGFEAPDWLGPDVTEDLRYKNQRLARDGAP